MAFVAIDPNSIEVGDPLKKELFDLIRTNEIDLDSRLNQVENTAKKIPFFKFLFINAAVFTTGTGVTYYEADDDFTITDAFIRIFEKGSLTGALEIDIKKSITDLDGTSFVSIFTTRPKITMASASDYDASTNQVFNPAQISVSKGDFLRLDITEMPTSGVLSRFLISSYGE
jgi:hypothetical protein